MSSLSLGIVLLLAQLTAPGNALPQVLTPEYKNAPARSGKMEVTVHFSLLPGFAISHTPPINLKLTDTSGLRLEQKEFTTPDKDPKSKDEYYVDLPEIKIPVNALKPGVYTIPAKLTYFFCSKKDGFCSKQSVDLKIPVRAE
ncbi:MAG TPA: hypothetical protein VFY29_00525 [Terriglobia bacterium]|nr:hypothetical protein [Terriglobia bacterium]